VEKAISVSNATLCQIEHGCTPRLDSALKIAAFVDIPVEDIWALKENK
jgi:DNA-binding XRE family transcriptional regulator